MLLLTPLSIALVAPPPKSTIVGAGPAGLATAVLLAKRGWPNVEVLDRLEPPPPLDGSTWTDTARFYLIGIGGRGQKALKAIDAWDEVQKVSAVVRGRKDWAPGATEGVETIRADRPPSYVIQRDRLVASLLAQARELGVTVRHSVDVSGISWDGDEAILQCSPCGEECALDDEGGKEYDGAFELRTPFVVASDGVRRTVASAMEAEDAAEATLLPFSRFKLKKFEDTAVRVYKTVPLKLPADWRGDINYSCRTSKFNFDALPAPVGRAPADAPADGAPVSEYCGVLLIKPDDEATQGLADVPAARKYFDEYLPQFSGFISDAALASVIAKPPSRLPVFRFAGPRLHRGASTVVLGDAVHSVKPYFGLGVNSAFEDVAALGDALDEETTLGGATAAFSAKRAAEARVLVELSRSFDRRGLAGFATFIGPIIMDAIFGKLPLVGKLFAPNTLALLQNPEYTYAMVRWRKRADRAVQLALLAAIGTGVGALLRRAAAAVVALVPRRALLAGGALAVSAAAVKALRGRGAGDEQQQADIADVLAKTTKKEGKRVGY